MNANSEFSLCPLCAAQQRTCCQGTEIYITRADLRRISASVAGQDFYEYRAPVNPIYGDNDDDPIWMQNVFRPDGTRRVLRRDSFGNCFFLGEKGCRLDIETRPLICRLYPYEYDAAAIHEDPAQGCPIHLLPKGLCLTAAVKMDLETAKRWHKQLYKEITEENDHHENWIDIRLAV